MAPDAAVLVEDALNLRVRDVASGRVVTAAAAGSERNRSREDRAGEQESTDHLGSVSRAGGIVKGGLLNSW